MASHTHSHSHSHAGGHADSNREDHHDASHGGSNGRERALIKICIGVTACLMLVEIVVGYLFNSLALVADSLNDLVAFIIQLYATQLMELQRVHSRAISGFSYGFGRTQYIANLVSGTMLLALCLTLTLEGLQRLYSPEIMTMPPLILGVGLLALIWNVVMMSMFAGSHGGHTHSHGGHSHSLGHEDDSLWYLHPHSYRFALNEAGRAARYDLLRRTSPSRAVVQHSILKSRILRSSSTHQEAYRGVREASDVAADHHSGDKQTTLGKISLSALAVHALADAVGNVAIIIDGAVSWCFGPPSGIVSGRIAHFDGIGYIDPLCALVVVWIILKHAFPLVASSSYALMQAIEPAQIIRYRRALETPDADWVPTHLQSHFTVRCLDLHVWKLSKNTAFATVKLAVEPKQFRSVEFTPADLEHLIRNVKTMVFDFSPANITVEVDPPAPFLSHAAGERRRSYPLKPTSLAS